MGAQQSGLNNGAMVLRLGVLAVIPPQASVAANTPLVPLLARRELLVRFPVNTGYLDRMVRPERGLPWTSNC